MTRVGIQIEPQYGFTFDEIIQIAQLAEQQQYHAIWTSDHLIWDADSTTRNCFEAWTLLSALASLTQTLRLGSLVTCYAHRYPSMLAKTVACVDTISSGRIDCGIGAGWNDAECRAYGIPFPDVNTRMDQLSETAQILKHMWTKDRVSFHGQHYTVDDALCAPKPVQHPLPLWIGGQGEHRLLRAVAEYADGWNMVLGRSVKEVKHKLEVLERHCEAVGRDPSTLDKSLFILTFLFDSEAEFNQLQANQAEKLGPGFPAALQRAHELGLAGSASQVTDAIKHYQALGFDYFIALFPYTHERDQIVRFAEEVCPSLTA